MNNRSSIARKLENKTRLKKQRRTEKEPEETLLEVKRRIAQERFQQHLKEKKLLEVADDLQRYLADKRTGAFNLFFPPDNHSPNSTAELYYAQYTGKRERDWAWTVSKVSRPSR